MTKRVRCILLAFIIILAGTAGWNGAAAQSGDQQYFPETGHWVTGEFLQYYQSAKDPLLVYGYPITDAFQDPLSGRLVQYFQRARFEQHTDAPSELRVQLGHIGDALYKKYGPGQPLPIQENFPACQLFPETGFRVCYAFLDFFKANGGVAQFGYPISNFESHDERIVQYFQRARLEWRPEQPPGQRVVLGDLGSEYFNVFGENPLRLRPSASNNLVQTILSLKVRAFPANAVTGLEGKQTVYVIVRDQNQQPVANAQVVVIVRPPAGQEGRYILLPTDKNGIATYTFSFAARERGLAQILVAASYHNIQEQTVTSFHVWY